MNTANQIKSSVELSPPHFTSRSPIHFQFTAFVLPTSEFTNIFIEISFSLVISLTFSFKLDKYSSILLVQNPRIESRNAFVSNFDNNIHPVKNVTWKFHVISCDKSMSVWSKSTPNSMTIPCHLSKFPLFSMLEHDMDFGQVQVQVMEFPWHLLRK